MKPSNSELLYVHINCSEHYMFSHGISMLDFSRSIAESSQSLLLLQHTFDAAQFHSLTLFHYVDNKQFLDLTDGNTHTFGDISCVDFDVVDALDELEGQEIAELLYLSHMKRPLNSAFFKKLNNKFIYFSHDDGWFNKIYFRQLEDFYRVIGSVISEKIKSRTKQKNFSIFRKVRPLKDLDPSTLDSLLDLWKEGAVMDFHNMSLKGKSEIPVYIIGDFWNMDDMVETYGSLKKKPDLLIQYNRKDKCWNIS